MPALLVSRRRSPAPTMDNARLEIETNYLGTLAMCRALLRSSRATAAAHW
jgi:hypothetical protein